jgi:calnexin
MQNDILFDNIYIGHSIEDAAALQKETFDVKIKAEKAEEEATKPKEEEKPKSPSDLVFKDDPVKYIREKVDLFMTIAKTDPINAAKFVPEVAGGLGVILLIVVSVLLTLVSNAGSAPSKEQVKGAAKKAKDAVVDAKDKAAEAISTGTEKAQSEVNKRTTRASAQ